MSPSTRSLEAARRRHAPVFAALGDETRLALVDRLAQGPPRSLVELTAGTSLTRQGISKHLGVLEQARLVRSVRVGRERFFELDPAPLREVASYAELVTAHWDRALARLRTLVEEP